MLVYYRNLVVVSNQAGNLRMLLNDGDFCGADGHGAGNTQASAAVLDEENVFGIGGQQISCVGECEIGKSFLCRMQQIIKNKRIVPVF